MSRLFYHCVYSLAFLKGARDWMVCEGFQLVLKLQAEALIDLGVCPQFKVSKANQIMWMPEEVFFFISFKRCVSYRQMCYGFSGSDTCRRQDRHMQ